MEQLAQALREEMARRSHSDRQAGALIGVSEGTVRNWRKGWLTNSPTIENIWNLSDYLGVSPFVTIGWLGFITAQESEDIQAIPGSLGRGDAIALIKAQRRGYLNPAVA